MTSLVLALLIFFCDTLVEDVTENCDMRNSVISPHRRFAIVSFESA